MKPFVILLLLFFAFTQAQIHQPSNIKEAFYVYNHKKDTLFFPKVAKEGFGTVHFAIADSLQMDYLGNKEIIISVKLDCGLGEHGGTFDRTKVLKYTKYEIWNLDSKTKIFEFYNSYLNSFSDFNVYAIVKNTYGKQTFSCDVSFKENIIFISKAEYTSSGDFVFNGAQNNIIISEGTYQFIENNFQRLSNFKISK